MLLYFFIASLYVASVVWDVDRGSSYAKVPAKTIAL